MYEKDYDDIMYEKMQKKRKLKKLEKNEVEKNV